MDSLNFLRSNFAQVQPEAKPQLAPEVKQSPPNYQNFSHGSNVVMKRGTYKGYYGYIYDDDIRPARFEVEIEEEQFVPVENNAEVGMTIDTDFGPSRITERIPELLVVSVGVSSPTGQEQHELRLPQDAFVRVVAFKDASGDSDTLIKLATLEQVTEEDERVTCDGRVLKLDYNKDKTAKQLYAELSLLLIAGTKVTELLDERLACQTSQLLFPDMFFVVASNIANQNFNYLGYYGILRRVIGEQYRIVYRKRVLLAAKFFTRNGNTVEITKGPYKGNTGTFIEKHYPRITVYLDAIGRKISDHLVKEGEAFAKKSLTVKDVFHLDLLLKNGNYFEVKRIEADDNNKITKIIGIEKNVPSIGYTAKEIVLSDIEKTMPGFSFSSQTKEDRTVTETETEFVNEDVEPKLEETDDVDEEENNGSYDDYEKEEKGETEESQNNTEAVEQEGPEYKASFKDTERTEYSQTKLTTAQKEIKTMIDKVLSLQGLPDSEFSVWELIENIESAVNKMKQTIKSNTGADKWVRSDTKYIVACLVLYKIIQSDFMYVVNNNSGNMIGTYLDKLVSNKFFGKKDTTGSYFLKNGWTSAFTVNNNVVGALMASKDYSQVIEIMFENANAYLRELYSLPEIAKGSRVHKFELIPLTRKVEEKRAVTITDLLENPNQPITPSIRAVIWGVKYQDTLFNFKEALANKILESNSKTIRDVYEYVQENIEQAPIELARMRKLLKQKHRELDRKKAERLQSAWTTLLKYLNKDYQQAQSERQQKNQQLQTQQTESKKRRQDALERTGKLQSLMQDLSLDDTTDDTTTDTGAIEMSFKKMKLGKKTFKVPTYN
ncbi:MAG: hypothetical protein EBU90_04840 [Proteobacteria bacterium]|nr:hypothetical protein [Pseudomonadota bacterium]NBP13755.1 hypothetical protein [bacterium]